MLLNLIYLRGSFPQSDFLAVTLPAGRKMTRKDCVKERCVRVVSQKALRNMLEGRLIA